MEENKEQKLNQNNLEIEENVGEAGAETLSQNKENSGNQPILQKKNEESAKELKNESDGPSEFVKNLEKNIEIHSMPKRFRLDHGASQSSRKVGMMIFAGGFIILAIGAFAAYRIFFSSSTANNNNEEIIDDGNIGMEQNQEEETLVNEEKEVSDEVEAAKDAYFNFKSAIASINSLADYDKLVGQYGTFSFVNAWSKIASEAAGWPDDENSQLAALLKNFSPSLDILKNNLKASVKDGEVDFSIFDIDYQVEIAMVYDGEEWRINKESGFSYYDGENNEILNLETWIKDTNDNLATTTDNTLEKSEDTDGDGLLDTEEAILRTDKNSKDSDNDGYEDLVELNNSYNPAGAGRIEENSALETYNNKDFNYSLLYPKDWTISAVGGADSLFITSASGELFQVAVQPNADKESIDDWYKSQFNVEEINSGQRITIKDGQEVVWSGIKGSDGLTVYLTSSDQEYIFAIAYNPVQSDILNYPNLFDLLVRSFRLD